MEIRAKLSLEASKFTGGINKTIAAIKTFTSANKVSADKIDSYINQQAANREKQFRRTDAMEIQSAREKNKILAKLELEKYRNTGGIKPGTNAGMPIPIKDVTNIFSYPAKEQKRFLKELTAAYKESEKEKEAATRNRTKQQAMYEKIWRKMEKQEAKASAASSLAFYKEIAAYRKQQAQKDAKYAKDFAALEIAEAKRVAAEKKRIAALEKKRNFQNQIQGFRTDPDFESNLASTRYALYDISNRAFMFGTAMAASLGLAVKAAMEFESAFTSVERTTGLALNSTDARVAASSQRLRDTLIELSTQIPVTFQDLAQVSTLAAQLGIAADSVDEFAETVAKFSAITGLSVDEVGMSFGRLAELMNVPTEKFESLSSAIAYTGVNSVATDQEILRMSESISAATTQAGLAADETIGFAAALASLKVRPEEARGVLTRLFREFDLSVSAGGSKLDDLGRVIGRTSEDAAKLWEQDPSQFVQAFLKGAQASGRLNQVISALGITNTRELNVITRLAQNQDVLTQALSDSAEQYALGTYASESYGLVVDDLASKITMLQNELAAFGDSLGKIIAPVIGQIVDGLRNFVGFLTSVPGPIKVVGMFIVALVAGLSLMAAMLTGSIAALLALRLAMDNLKLGSHQANLSLGTFRALLISMIPNAGAATTVTAALANSMRGAAASMNTAAVSARGLNMALGVLGIAATAVLAIFSIISMNEDAAKNLKAIERRLYDAAGGAEAFADAIAKDAEAIKQGAKEYGKLEASASKLSKEEQEAGLAARKAAVERAKANRGTEEGNKAYREATDALKAYQDELSGINSGIETNTVLLGDNTKAVIVNALSKMGENGDKDFWMMLSQIPGEAQAALSASGFDAAKMIEEGLKKAGGAEAYLDKFVTDFMAANQGQQLPNWYKDWIAMTRLAAEEVDNTRTTIEGELGAQELRNKVLGIGTGLTEDSIDGIADLNEEIKTLVSSLGAEEAANQKVADSFNSMIDGMEGTSGEMSGMTKAARENMSAFKSFMDSAVEASIQAGEGALGTAERIASGLNTMEQAGYDTSDAFNISKDVITNAFYVMSGASADAEININGRMTSIRDALADAGSLQGVKDVINAFYAARIAAEGASGALYVEWSRTIAALSGTTTIDEDFKKTTSSAGKAQTALEKLQAILKKLYGWTNKKIALNESIASLGDSMRENGRTFSVWSESGRENVGSLLDVIDQLAIESNGDLKKFANSLASMRAALVQSGAPASALKFIDDALKKIGKSGKATTKQVQQFVKVLGSAGDEISTLKAVNAAIEDMASSMRDQFDAYFYQSDMIDQITLGWLDLADAAETARDEIRNAEESIRDARLEIEASKAAIDKLTANKGTLQYQLAIALKYGDTLRADELKAEIADLEAQIAEERNNIIDSQGQIADAQDEIADANGRLGSNPTARQQIERNQLLRDMATRYLDVASAAIVNAEEGADLNAIMEDQIGSFEQMAREAGFTEEEIMSISGVMRDVLTKAINDIPKNPKVTVSSETSAALAKVKKFVSDANAALAGINSVNVGVNTGGGSTAPGTGGSTYLPVARGGLIVGPGTGTSDSIAARVSNGEFVVKAAAVRRYGVDFMNAINNMQSFPMARMNVPAVAGGGSQTVYLSTEDRQLLRAAIDRPIALYTDNATIAKSANDGNRILAKRGTR